MKAVAVNSEHFLLGSKQMYQSAKEHLTEAVRGQGQYKGEATHFLSLHS